MPARQPLPRLWLMTDERLGDRLLDAVARLPGGAGIVFRHYSLAEQERRALFERVKQAATGPVILAGAAELSLAWGADGSHGRHPGATTAPAHDLAEIRAAEVAGAALLFLSPVFPTRSHPDAPAMGPAGFAALANQARHRVDGGASMDHAPAES